MNKPDIIDIALQGSAKYRGVLDRLADEEAQDTDDYRCYLNGNLYGTGSLAYMHELFTDYVLTSRMYGRSECEFKIERG